LAQWFYSKRETLEWKYENLSMTKVDWWHWWSDFRSMCSCCPTEHSHTTCKEKVCNEIRSKNSNLDFLTKQQLIPWWINEISLQRHIHICESRYKRSRLNLMLFAWYSFPFTSCTNYPQLKPASSDLKLGHHSDKHWMALSINL
jgi:hypothetical protein